MIKVLSACSYELDNPEKTAQDILNQIDIKNSLLKNSVALPSHAGEMMLTVPVPTGRMPS
jgi:hypothetical protein